MYSHLYRDHPNNIPYTGCIYKMTEELQKQLIILGAASLGVSIVQIFGLICSCCLYIKLKNFDWQLPVDPKLLDPPNDTISWIYGNDDEDEAEEATMFAPNSPSPNANLMR
jgi:hypothetical protein